MPTRKKYTKKTKKPTNPNSTYKWLNNDEAEVLLNGGYYDSEGLLHNGDGCVRCTAMVKSTGRRCKNFAVPGETTCRVHGGVMARKAAGKLRIYSAFIQDPTLASIYENTANTENKELMGIREELGLLRALLARVVKESESLNTRELKDIAGVVSEIRQTAENCTKAEVRLGQLIEVGSIVNIVKQLADIIQKYITDEDILRKISYDFDNVILPSAGVTTPQPAAQSPTREICEPAGEIC
jgi:hypothetical protein